MLYVNTCALAILLVVMIGNKNLPKKASVN